MRTMTKEELDNIKVGDKVILLDGKEGIVFCRSTKRFACLCKNGMFYVDQEWVDNCKKLNLAVIENPERYLDQRYDWFSNFKIKTEPEKPITKAISCKRCKGTGIIANEFFSYNCDCQG